MAGLRNLFGFKETFAILQRGSIFAARLEGTLCLLTVNVIVAQLDRASHYGCEGLGFDSLR